jgi:hypothetical protein
VAIAGPTLARLPTTMDARLLRHRIAGVAALRNAG